LQSIIAGDLIGVFPPLEELKSLIKVEIITKYEEGFDIDVNAYLKKVEKVSRGKDLLELYHSLPEIPLREDYPYVEPSDLDDVLKERPGNFRSLEFPRDIKDKLLGGWLGRVCGCMLGKPVEGWSREKIKERLEEIGEYPLREPYFPLEAFTEEEFERVSGLVRGSIREAARDDDLDYTILNLLLYEEKGDSFTSLDVGEKWLVSLPYGLMYTAERVAYRNLVWGLKPPETAVYSNPFREWIGAQIRADLWGYVSPGDPEKASLLAYRDASLSHTRNGIYGEMFFAAAIAAAFSLDSPEEIILEALKAIPRRSIFAEMVKWVLSLYRANASWEDAVSKILEKYDYHPVHTINNAALVIAAFLWGEGDYSKTVIYAVLSGLDTDCNGATAGSLVGVMIGAASIPFEWVSPLNDVLNTAVSGLGKVKISELANRTLKAMKLHRG